MVATSLNSNRNIGMLGTFTTLDMNKFNNTSFNC